MADAKKEGDDVVEQLAAEANRYFSSDASDLLNRWAGDAYARGQLEEAFIFRLAARKVRGLE